MTKILQVMILLVISKLVHLLSIIYMKTGLIAINLSAL